VTALRFDEEGIDVEYAGTEFRLEKELVEEATQKAYVDATDHDVLQMVEPDPDFGSEPRRIGDIL